MSIQKYKGLFQSYRTYHVLMVVMALQNFPQQVEYYSIIIFGIMAKHILVVVQILLIIFVMEGMTLLLKIWRVVEKLLNLQLISLLKSLLKQQLSNQFNVSGSMMVWHMEQPPAVHHPTLMFGIV